MHIYHSPHFSAGSCRFSVKLHMVRFAGPERNKTIIMNINQKNRRMFGMILATLMAIVMAVMLQGSVSGRYLYYIKVDGRSRMAYTRLTDPVEIINEGGYTLGEYDFCRMEPTGDDGKSFNIYVIRGIPITVHADGTSKTVAAEEGLSYADALAAAGIPVGIEDIVSRDLSETVSRNGEVTIQRVTYSMRAIEEVIPFGYEYEPTRHMPEGKVKQLSAGVNGVKSIYYKDRLVDGVVVSTAYSHEEVTKAPVSAKAQIGDADAPIDYIQAPADFKLDENGIPVSYTKVITGKGTAYSARPGAWGASGRYLHTGYVAVDPKIIPYGSRLYIRSTDGSYVYGYAIAADTGIALLDGRVLVDVYFNTYGDSCKFGAKKVDVYVLS